VGALAPAFGDGDSRPASSIGPREGEHQSSFWGPGQDKMATADPATPFVGKGIRSLAVDAEHLGHRVIHRSFRTSPAQKYAER